MVGLSKLNGTQTGIQKKAISSTNYDFGRFSRFTGNIFFLVSFLRKIIGFIAPEMVPWLSKQSEDQSGGPRTNLEVFGDEMNFQYVQKT